MLVAIHVMRQVQKPAEAEVSVEVPSTNIAQTMEAAAAAVPATRAEEDEQLETMTVAEPEMEVEEQPSEGESGPDEEMPDITEYPEHVSRRDSRGTSTFAPARAQCDHRS